MPSPKSPADLLNLPYRPCVGVALFNKDGLVFVGNRIQLFDVGPNTWQMPQGGIDKGENPTDAAFRELQEETGVARHHAEIIGEVADWLTYDLPEDLLGKALKGKYRGQKQRWFAMRFTGEDTDIDLTADAHQEFTDWRWVKLPEITDLIVPFKLAIYERVAKDFAPLAKPTGR
ncbi:MAG: RNA pyrophosphohydrolase [Parvibaculaceae bacterium]